MSRRFLRSKVTNNVYHESFEKFVGAIDEVLDNLERRSDELASLMAERFEALACD